MIDAEFDRLSTAELYALLTPEERAAVDKPHWDGERRRARFDWAWFARPQQRYPGGGWLVWLVMAGRGFGKTRMGAEWARDKARRDPAARIALVAANYHEARAVMVEGPSGLLRLGRMKDRPTYEPSRRLLTWPNGAEARLYSAEDPDSLRGGQHSHAWGDEIAKWAHGPATWMNLRMGLRLGSRPQAVMTTTPRPVTLVKALIDDEAVRKTYGRTADNARNLPEGFLAALEAAYAGTRLGRQELDGALIEEVEGALWSREVLEECRVRPLSPLARGEGLAGDAGAGGEAAPHPNPSPEGEGLFAAWGAKPLSFRGGAGGGAFGISLRRVVVAVDPPASSGGDACGIVAAGLGEDGLAYVLGDFSVEKASPDRWGTAVAAAVALTGADKVVAEANNGGEMVANVIRAGGLALPVTLVRASRGKSARAEPVSALYAHGRVRHCGAFQALEDEMCGLTIGGGYEGPGRSPDRADALVWALTELMLGPPERVVRARWL